MNTLDWRAWRDRLLLQEDLNFLLTNRIPRLAATRFMRRFSKIEQPWVRDASIAVWRACCDVDLSDEFRVALQCGGVAEPTEHDLGRTGGRLGHQMVPPAPKSGSTRWPSPSTC